MERQRSATTEGQALPPAHGEVRIVTRVLSGQPWDMLAPAFMFAEFTGALRSESSIGLVIRTAFLPLPIKRGTWVVTECYLGTTGARIVLKAENAALSNHSPCVTVETQSKVSHGSSVETIINLKTPKFGGTDSGMQSKGAATTTSEVAFTSGEALLQVTPVGSTLIQWSLRPHIGLKAIADYLEGQLNLSAVGTWTGSVPTFLSTVEAHDRRVFGPNGKALSRLVSVAIIAKMLVNGSELPEYGPVAHELTVERVA
jgi:hypothetical protein